MIVLSTLGSAAIDIDGHRIVPAAERMFAGTLYLATERGRAISRPALQELLFPADSVKDGAHSLRQMLYQFRKLGIDGGSDSGFLRIAPEAVCDPVTAIGTGGPIEDDVLRAIAVGYLPGYFPSFSRPFTEWLDAHRASVNRTLLRPLAAQLATARATGDWSRTERVARACLSLDPLHEEATLVLAENLALSGSKSEAMHMLDRLSADIGASAGMIKLPATVLRRRISERIPDSYAKPEPPLVGRDEELRRIATFLDPSDTDPTTLLLLVGDAGIGKTRLLERAQRLCALSGIAFGRVGIQPYYVRRPLSFFSDVIPQLMAMSGALGCSPESLQFLRVLQHGSADHLDPALQEPDAEAQFARILRAIDDILDAITAETRLLLVAEDAHDLDPISARLLSLIASKRGSRRLLLAASLRPDSTVERALRESERCSVLRLPPLTAESSSELVDRLCDVLKTRADTRLKDWWTSVAGGNPLFLTMLVAHPSRSAERFSIPSSLKDLLMRRLETLSESSLLLFEACAVLGENATVPNIEYCTGLGVNELHSGTRELERAGLVIASGQLIRPVHRLLAEAAVETAPGTTRLLLHRRAAECVERLATVAPAGTSWSAAEHWASIDDSAREAASLRTCADQLMAIGRASEACDLYQEAAKYAPPRSQEELLLAATYAADSAGRPGTIVTLFQQLGLEQQSLEVGRETPAGRFVTWVEACLLSGQSFNRRLDTLLQIASDNGLSRILRFRACQLLTGAAEVMWDPSFAAQAFVVASSIPATDSLEEEQLLHASMNYHSLFGDRDAGVEAARSFIELVMRRPLSGRMSRQIRSAAIHLHRGGASTEACDLLLSHAMLLRERRLNSSAYLVLTCAGENRLDVGDFDRAADIQHQADALAMESIDRSIAGLSNRIRLAFAAGDMPAVSRWLDIAKRIPGLSIGRFRVVTLAYSVRLRRLTEDLAPPDVTELVEGHLAGRRFRDHDEIALETFQSLASIGQGDYARQLAAEYRVCRRDRYQPEPDLARFLSGAA